MGVQYSYHWCDDYYAVMFSLLGVIPSFFNILKHLKLLGNCICWSAISDCQLVFQAVCAFSGLYRRSCFIARFCVIVLLIASCCPHKHKLQLLLSLLILTMVLMGIKLLTHDDDEGKFAIWTESNALNKVENTLCWALIVNGTVKIKSLKMHTIVHTYCIY